MTEPIGRRRWAIPDGAIPSVCTAPEPEMKSDEKASVRIAASSGLLATALVAPDR